MKILKLSLKNIRSIEGELEVPLNEDSNLNLVSSSNNGMGKTTIFHAIYFLLFGITPDTVESMMNWNADSMSASIEFEHNGKQFSIAYNNANGKADKVMTIDNEQFNGLSTCHKKIKEYFDPSLFVGATRLLQNEKNFVNVKDSERRESLKKVFNTDYTQEVKDLDKEIKDLESNDLNKVNSELISLHAKTFEDKPIQELPYSLEDVVTKKSTIEAINKELASISILLDSVEQNKKDYETLKEDILVKKLALSSIHKKIETVKESLVALNSYSKDTTKLEDMTKELSSIKLVRLQPFNELLLDTEKESLSSINSSIQVLSKKMKDCSNGVCPTCGKPFESHDVHEIESELKSLSEQKTAVELKIQELKEIKTSVEDSINKNNENKIKKNLLETKIESESKRLATEEENNNKLIQLKNEELASLQESTSKFNIQELETKLSLIKLESSDELSEKYRKKKSVLDELTSQVFAFDRVVLENELNKKHNLENILLREKVNKDIELKEAELSALQEKKVVLEKMKVFLRKEFPSYVISAVIENIETSMNEFINKVYYKPLDVSITGNDDVISVMYGTGKKKIDCVNASGAEEALLAIAYCMSLNKINGYNIFFLDEVDANFTNQQALIFAEIMASIKDELDDLWIISHVLPVKDLYASLGANVISVGGAA